VAKNVGNNHFLDEAGLEQIGVTVLRGNFLCLRYEFNYTSDEVHSVA